MLQRISDFPLTAYIAITGAFRSLRNDERGLSGVVVTILLILVAVLAVILIWSFLGKWLDDLWSTITRSGTKIKEYTP